MGVFDRLEKGMEKALNSAFSRTSKSGVKPVELASALRREADDRAAAVDRTRTVIPNEYTIKLSEADFNEIDQWGAQALADELATIITEYATEQQYALLGGVTVTFEEDLDLTAGNFTTSSTTVRGAAAPATTVSVSAQHPLLDIDGVRYILTGATTVIGRGSEADIVVDDPGVSRRHLEISVTPGGVVARDMDSTNGMFVEGHQVPAATLLDGNSLTIGRTRIMFWTSDPDNPSGRKA